MLKGQRNPLLVAGWVLTFGMLLMRVLWRPMHFMPDDALFYLQIARNIAAGNGSTFICCSLLACGNLAAGETRSKLSVEKFTYEQTD